jgi:hypothetical protein
MAADAEPGHEGGDDHRDRVESDAAVQREDALPRDLVDECGCTAQQEQQSGQDDPARLKRRQETVSA